jgi:ADP-ribosylglycohydrolase
MTRSTGLSAKTINEALKMTGNYEDLNKAKGVIFGLAIGDALGARTEFMKLDQIKARYGKDGIRDLPSPALFTDDT